MTSDSLLAPFFSALERGPRTLELDRMLADALLSAGDSRGEFMALTLKRHDQAGLMSALTRKKLTKLFRRQRLDWLGPLAGVVVRAPEATPPLSERDELPFDGFSPEAYHVEVWERGFPVRLACRLTGSSAGAPQWLTVKELHLAPADGALPTELAHPTTRHLRCVYASDHQDPTWPGHLRDYLSALGREALLEAPTEWRGEDVI